MAHQTSVHLRCLACCRLTRREGRAAGSTTWAGQAAGGRHAPALGARRRSWARSMRPCPCSGRPRRGRRLRPRAQDHRQHPPGTRQKHRYCMARLTVLTLARSDVARHACARSPIADGHVTPTGQMRQPACQVDPAQALETWCRRATAIAPAVPAKARGACLGFRGLHHRWEGAGAWTPGHPPRLPTLPQALPRTWWRRRRLRATGLPVQVRTRVSRLLDRTNVRTLTQAVARPGAHCHVG